ncbi:MAG: VCBS repeat-containing protein, partial [Planctomycetota bacterium]
LTDVPIGKLTIHQQQTQNLIEKKTPAAKWFREPSSLGNVWHQENQFDDFGFQPLLPHELSSEGPCMAWSDINKDGLLDCFIGGSAGFEGQILLGQGNGEFIRLFSRDLESSSSGEDSDAVFADFDGDGDDDLLVVRGSYEFIEGRNNNRNLLFWNDGLGDLKLDAKNTVPDAANISGSVSICDYDHDGDMDVFIGTRVKHADYPLSSDSHIWRNDDGRLIDVSNSMFSEGTNLGMVTDSQWADINGDGWEDLLITREWDSLKILINQNGQSLVDSPAGDIKERTGWWRSLEVGDVDLDGDLDILATNVGLNTKYKSSFAKPMALYYGSFDDSGKSHIVEVKREGDVCYPERGRSCSSHAMPFIADKFETYHEFGLASLNDIYGDDQLQAARNYESNTFEHGIFVNDGEGQFKFKVLDRITQIAPSLDAKLGDLDEDGDLDIVLGQNFFGPQPETGKYDGGIGQILTNDGQGNFTPLPTSISGFKVREVISAIEIIDLNQDGKKDLAITTNNGPASIFWGNR